MAGPTSGARLAAAVAFAGLAYLAPQSTAVANADSTDATAPGATATADHSPAAARRGNGKVAAAPALRRAGSTRAPATASPELPALRGEISANGARAFPGATASAVTVPARLAVRAQNAALQESVPVAATPAPTGPATIVPAPTRSGSAPLTIAASTLTAPATVAAPTALAVTQSPVVQKLGTILAALTYKAADWVYGMPGGPAKELFTAALLLAQRALTNAGLGVTTGTSGGQEGSGSGFGTGNVKLTIRNESHNTVEIWDNSYNDASEWVYKATLDNSESWTATAGSLRYLIEVNGVVREEVYADNPWSGSPFVSVRFSKGPNTGSNITLTSEPNRGQSEILRDSLRGFSAWVYRGHDIDSGDPFQANTKSFVVSLWDIPPYPFDPKR